MPTYKFYEFARRSVESSSLLAGGLLLALGSSACGEEPSPDEDETMDGDTTDGEEETTTDTETGSGSDSETTSDTETDTGEDLCGNAIVDPDEACDDGLNDGNYGGCAPGCGQLGGSCGDGETQPEYETCDQGGANGNESCNDHCQVPGTVLDTIYEVFSTDAPQPQGIRATYWNGRPTAVVSGWETTVWELDSDTVETYRRRSIEQNNIHNVTGALGLETGELLLAGSSYKQAVRFDENLIPQWSFIDTHPPVSASGFVGVAPIAGGAMLGSLHASNQNDLSAYWVVGVANGGLTLWEAIEVIAGTDDIYARDLRGISGGRAVLLTDVPLPSYSGFRIYESDGSIEIQVMLPQVAGNFRQLCAGENGFFLLKRTASTIVLRGYNMFGETALSTSFNVLADDSVVDTGCAALEDNSPIVGITLLTPEETTILEVHGFDKADSAWTQTIQLDGLSPIQPEVLLEPDRSRAWVFVTGMLGDQRFVYTAVIAV